jgi:hypothetical protein
MINEIPLSDEARAHIQGWIDALRSGDYKQTKHRLGSISRKGTLRHCCLGVACDIMNHDRWMPIPDNLEEVLGDEDFLPLEYEIEDSDKVCGDKAHEFWAQNDYCEALAAMNDRGADFQEIADALDLLLTDDHIPLEHFIALVGVKA